MVWWWGCVCHQRSLAPLEGATQVPLRSQCDAAAGQPHSTDDPCPCKIAIGIGDSMANAAVLTPEDGNLYEESNLRWNCPRTGNSSPGLGAILCPQPSVQGKGGGKQQVSPCCPPASGRSHSRGGVPPSCPAWAQTEALSCNVNLGAGREQRHSHMHHSAAVQSTPPFGGGGFPKIEVQTYRAGSCPQTVAV